MQISLSFFLTYIVLCTGPVGQVCFLSVVFALLLFVIQPFLFNGDLNLAKTIVSIAFVLSLHLVDSLTATLFLYIAELHGKLHQLILENIRLLNGMHEGLLILSKTDQSILFVNRPVQKLLKNSFSIKPENQNANLNEKMFKPVKLTAKDKINPQIEIVSTTMNKRPPLSLDQIITAQCDEPAKA